VDLDPLQAKFTKADTRQCADGLGGQALADVLNVNPVADLGGAGTDPHVQAPTTEDPAFVAVKDAVRVVRAGLEAAAESFQPDNPLFE
jgi:hypothetical protein